jgi:ketosteroid isomerase-like protein
MPQSVASAADTVREAYDAFGRGDIPAILEMLADDVSWNAPEPLPHAMRTTGRDGVAQFFTRLSELWSDLGLDVDTIVDDGSGRGIGVGTARGKLRGKPASYGYVHVFTVRDGKVARFDEYVAAPEGGFPE